MEKKNMFADAAAKREKEQQKLTETLTATAEQAKQDSERTTMTISMSVAQKKRLKKYATDQGTTVAALIQGWIDLTCN